MRAAALRAAAAPPLQLLCSALLPSLLPGQVLAPQPLPASLTVVKELAEGRGGLCAAGLLPVEAVEVEVRQRGAAAQEVHPPRGDACRGGSEQEQGVSGRPDAEAETPASPLGLQASAAAAAAEAQLLGPYTTAAGGAPPARIPSYSGR